MTAKRSILLSEAINVLNRAVREDREAVERLCDLRVDCNKILADDESIQVWAMGDGALKVGVIGLVNGLFGADAQGWGPIAAQYQMGCPEHGLAILQRHGQECPFEDCGEQLCVVVNNGGAFETMHLVCPEHGVISDHNSGKTCPTCGGDLLPQRLEGFGITEPCELGNGVLEQQLADAQATISRQNDEIAAHIKTNDRLNDDIVSMRKHTDRLERQLNDGKS